MRRRSINPSELKPHKNPIPMACLVDNILMTSAIQGHDPKTGKFPIDKIHQIKLAFDALGSILLEANATPEDVVKIDLFFKDKNDRALVNPCLLYTSPSPRDATLSRMPSSA